mgnify:CR=1 FL=1|tara:strand:- start:50 stop:301 length:252 start_codon:yes stop_codon:yes gene_type:complete
MAEKFEPMEKIRMNGVKEEDNPVLYWVRYASRSNDPKQWGNEPIWRANFLSHETYMEFVKRVILPEPDCVVVEQGSHQIYGTH